MQLDKDVGPQAGGKGRERRTAVVDTQPYTQSAELLHSGPKLAVPTMPIGHFNVKQARHPSVLGQCFSRMFLGECYPRSRDFSECSS